MSEPERVGLTGPSQLNFAATGETYMEILRCGCTLMKQWGIFCSEHAALVHTTIKEAVNGAR